MSLGTIIHLGAPTRPPLSECFVVIYDTGEIAPKAALVHVPGGYGLDPMPLVHHAVRYRGKFIAAFHCPQESFRVQLGPDPYNGRVIECSELPLIEP